MAIELFCGLGCDDGDPLTKLVQTVFICQIFDVLAWISERLFDCLIFAVGFR